MHNTAPATAAASVLVRLALNDGSIQNLALSDVEQAILTYRRARKAKHKANRAHSFAYSIDNGATWLR